MGYTVLHIAAEDGDIDRLQHLLTAGQCDINDRGMCEMTPLHSAAGNGHTQCVQLLLQHGVDTSIQDRGGMTPLHRAAHCGHTQCVQLLFQHGADTSIQDRGGMTPLHRAAHCGHTQCVQLLFQHGADTSIQDRVSVE
ncbi:ankyrin repeat domain-containing protein 39-like [Lingula anatina]|uniref:Ankyrin repeat domain-containing protein 39-like n=1 Tax=Lingula anatina TaxID=7574 RepID=A0A2R2MT92_LINAN|nr:ankyrin repeat domain-containing protein 39-like [Lingula anatina]|eukprot:XP_023933464.1 ankyrin repeat domain-containing protein 39-like [Lingula anatina]